MQKVFYIPNQTEYVVVSDMFAKDYTGGAELTLEAIMSKCPGRYFQLHSASMTAELVQKYASKYWVIANFAAAPGDALAELVRSHVRFSVVECDYKYCKYRSSHLHQLQEGKPCDCNQTRSGRFVRALFGKARWVMFMSQGQIDEYNRQFPNVSYDNFVVQSSTFSDETISYLSVLRSQRNKIEIKDVYAVLKGGTWIKAEQQTVEWCRENGIKFELIGGIPYREFLEKLYTYKGLVFRPAGFDTCPRLVIEAKMLGLDCLLNEYVQQKNELWFISDIETCENYLKTRAKFFWDKVKS